MTGASTEQTLQRAADLARRGKANEADELYRSLAQGDPSALLHLALPILQSGRLLDGLLLIEASLRFDARQPFAENLRGMTLARLGRFDEALACQTRAIALAPDYAEAYEDRGAILHHSGCSAEAISDLSRSVALKPDTPTAWSNLAFALTDARQYDNAAAALDRALALAPGAPMLLGERVFLDLLRCAWQRLDGAFAALDKAVDAGALPIQPFKCIATPSSPARQRVNAERYAAQYEVAPAPRARRRERIRLGYFSADLYGHATSFLAARLFELHDRARFETIAYSFGAAPQDDMRQRLERAFDKFIDVSLRSDRDVVALAREMEIDIAIDLKGYTTGSRPRIFAQRAAPVQVSYLGFPSTMGATFIDYLVADSTIIPPGGEAHYSEKIVRLPDTYQATDDRRQIAQRRFTRTELGLPERGFVFCCFNNSFKITPDVFDIWMRLLREVDGSALWLFESHPSVVANLRREASARGVTAERLVFAPRMSQAEHLARHAHADLFLDTFTCSAHTTASDALWAGLPVITRLGETFASRVAASLLNAIALPDLITRSHEEYFQLARRLAADDHALAAIKAKLAVNRLTHPLFDTPRFTRHIEAAYEAMHARALAGLAPDHIEISSSS